MIAAVQDVVKIGSPGFRDREAAERYFGQINQSFAQANRDATIDTVLLALDAATISASFSKPLRAAPPVLPEFIPKGKTSGVFRYGVTETALQSGKQGAASLLPKPSPGFNAITATHVEGHAAALMRQRGIDEATVFINNPVICTNCSRNLTHMLPHRSTLNVVLPDGRVITFVGNAR